MTPTSYIKHLSTDELNLISIRRGWISWPRFRNGFSKVQWGCNDIKIVYISNFSQFRSRGGVIENQFFPKFKKVQIILGEGGGQENYGLFPQIMVFFILNRTLSGLSWTKVNSAQVQNMLHLIQLGVVKTEQWTFLLSALNVALATFLQLP